MLSIDWNAFTPWPALAGGVLIGIAAAMLVLLNGRVAGVSSVLGGLLAVREGDAAWRWYFLAGLVAAPLLHGLIAAPAMPRIEASLPMLAAAGVLVGLGARYAGGCTSGHGVCGLSRLSPRSLAATLAFMGSGFATVFVLRHALA